MRRRALSTAGLAWRLVVGAIVGAFMAVMALYMGLGPAKAHPMPDSEIVVARGAERVDFTFRVPLDDLLLAIKGDPGPGFIVDTSAAGLAHLESQAALRSYLGGHIRLEGEGGTRVPLVIETISRTTERDADVGEYSEVEIKANAYVPGDAPLTLYYDLVIGRIANHRALVSDASGKSLGVIRYSLANKKAEALELPLFGEAANAPADASGNAGPAAPVSSERAPMWAIIAFGALFAGTIAYGIWRAVMRR